MLDNPLMAETESTGHQRCDDEVMLQVNLSHFCLMLLWSVWSSRNVKSEEKRGIRALFHILLVPVCLRLMHFSQISITASLHHVTSGRGGRRGNHQTKKNRITVQRKWQPMPKHRASVRLNAMFLSSHFTHKSPVPWHHTDTMRSCFCTRNNITSVFGSLC